MLAFSIGIYCLHAYVIGFVNQSVRYYPNGAIPFTKYFINYFWNGKQTYYTNQIPWMTYYTAKIVWPLAAMTISGFICQLIAQRPLIFFTRRWQYFLETVAAVTKGKKSYLILFLSGIVAALVISIPILNPLLCIILAIWLFIEISAEQSSPLLFVCTLIVHDVSRLFKKKAQPGYRGLSLLLTGAMIGFLLNGILQIYPVGQVMQYVTVIVFVALLMLYTGGVVSRKAVGKTMVIMFLFLGTAALYTICVYADDGGAREIGAKDLWSYFSTLGNASYYGNAAAASGGLGGFFGGFGSFGAAASGSGTGGSGTGGSGTGGSGTGGSGTGGSGTGGSGTGGSGTGGSGTGTGGSGSDVRIESVNKPGGFQHQLDGPNTAYGPMNSWSSGTWGQQEFTGDGGYGIHTAEGWGYSYSTGSYTGTTFGGEVHTGTVHTSGWGTEINGWKIETGPTVQGPAAAANLNMSVSPSSGHYGFGANANASAVTLSQGISAQNSNVQASASVGVTASAGAGFGIDVSPSGVQINFNAGVMNYDLSIGTTDGKPFFDSVNNILNKK